MEESPYQIESFNDFCNKYYPFLMEEAEILNKARIKQFGKPSVYIDVEYLTHAAVYDTLEYVFKHYQPDNKSGASLHTYAKLVLSCRLSDEFDRELRAANHLYRSEDAYDDVGRKISPEDFFDFHVFKDIYGSMSSLPIRLRGTREEIIAKLRDSVLSVIDKMDPMDQVIIDCWTMFGKKEYTQEVVKRLGLDPHYIQCRLSRIIGSLRVSLGYMRPEYLELARLELRSNVDFPPTREQQADVSITKSIDREALTSRINKLLESSE